MYRLYDYYEGKTLVAESDNWADIKKAKKEYKTLRDIITHDSRM